MKIAAVCCTWNRPELLGRLIECFNRQDYADRELVILDDADQYPAMEGNRWKLVSQRFRYPTLGDKRNAAARLVSDDVSAFAVCDDDDLYLPHHLSACVEALQDAQWCQPRQVLIADGKSFKRQATFRKSDPNNLGYQGGWAWQRGAFEKLGGYASISNGEDVEIAARSLALLGPSADTITARHPTPGYVYTWLGRAGRHLSAMSPPGDESGYQELGRQIIERVDRLNIALPADFPPPIEAEPRPRGW